MAPEERFVPRFAAEPPQEDLPYGRWEERLREEFLAGFGELEGAQEIRKSTALSTLAMRGEWFRDDEGTRTGQLKRPGFAASFYDLTVGLGYKPNASVQIRPEVRWDWTPDARPFNDQTDKAQLTAALDVIWRF